MGKSGKLDKNRSPNRSVQMMAQKSEFYSGPLPHPDMLAKFEQIQPGAADRILQMAEKQSSHRQDIEKAVIASKISDSKRGQIFAFVICILVSVIGSVLIYVGIDIAGYVALFLPLTTLAGAFLYGRKKAQEEREQKEKNNQ